MQAVQLEQVPGGPGRVRSLRDICISCLGKWVRYIEDVGDMDATTWLAVLHAASYRASPEIVCRVEATCPHLQCAEIDRVFWKGAVNKAFPSRRLPGSLVEPYPVQQRRVQAAVNKLADFIAQCQGTSGEPSAPSPSVPLSPPAGSLEALEEALVTVRLLKDTGAGHAVKAVRKQAGLDPAVQRRAQALQARWKAHCERATAPAAAAGDAPPEAPLPHRLSPSDLEKEMKRCDTWKGLYFVLQEQEAAMLARSAKRLTQAYAEAKSGQHRTQKLYKKKKKKPALTGSGDGSSCSGGGGGCKHEASAPGLGPSFKKPRPR